MERARPAITPEDKERWTALRAAAPHDPPEGWTSPTPHPVRVNDYDQPGKFARIYVNGHLRMVYEIEQDNSILVSLQRAGGHTPTDRDVEVAKSAFFAGKEVMTMSPMPGVVRFGGLS